MLVVSKHLINKSADNHFNETTLINNKLSDHLSANKSSSAFMDSVEDLLHFLLKFGDGHEGKRIYSLLICCFYNLRERTVTHSRRDIKGGVCNISAIKRVSVSSEMLLKLMIATATFKCIAMLQIHAGTWK